MAENFWRNCPGGICAPAGFLAAAEVAGLKRSGPDVALIFSERPASAAACFTRNRCPAAPVELSRQHLRKSGGHAQAILVNSGCANAGTGAAGRRNARRSVTALAASLRLPAASILVCSTGVIGLPLAADRIVAAVPRCVENLSRQHGKRAAQAILTTDTVLKVESITFQQAGCRVHIGGIAKGAGMIHPEMATMLAFITTDVAISPARLQRDLRWCVERSFNCITVDGDMSTNDTVMALANGASGVRVGAGGDGDEGGAEIRGPANPAPELPRISASHFRAALLEVCQRLARKIAWDGEGATRYLEIQVSGARSLQQARNVGRAIGRSNLVKTAIYGRDPNWGRVLSAVGASGESIAGSRVRLAVNNKVVAQEGVLKNLPDAAFASVWKQKRIRISVDLFQGKQSATCWSCDLSHEYIDINGSYRT